MNAPVPPPPAESSAKPAEGVRRTLRSNWQVFRWPLLVGVASLVGLVSALIGDGLYDALSWLALGGVVALMTIAFLRGR